MMRSSIVVIVIWLAALILHAQNTVNSTVPPRTLPQPDKRIIPTKYENLVPQALAGALWRVDHTYKATLRLKNHVQTASISVTPVLYLADGTRYPLAPITLAASGVATVDLNQQLQLMPNSLRVHISDFGSAGVEFSWPWESAVTATVENLDTVRSLILNSSAAPTGSASALQGTHQRIEGMWWTPNSDATPYLALTNTSDSQVPAVITVMGPTPQQTSTATQVSIGAHRTEWYPLSQLWPEIAKVYQGGITVAYDGSRAALIANGGVENESTGFSEAMTFAYHFAEASSPSIHAFASSGLMIGTPDPAMLFPKGLAFLPYAVLRNTSAHPLSVTGRVNYENSSVHNITLPPIQLAPYQTTGLPLADMVRSGVLNGFNGSINIMFSAQSHIGDLLISTGSVDQTGNFVFRVVPRPASLSASRDICFWKASPDGTDTMISLWNHSSQPSDLVVTLRHEKGTYKLPVHLEADHSAILEILPLIQNGTPDVDGNVLPITATTGSASVASALGDTKELTVALNTSTFNVKTATCGDVCDTCNGYTSAYIQDNPFAVAVSGTHQLDLYGHSGSGYNDRYTNSGSWSSAHTAIATVNNSNQRGLVTGQSAGTSTVNSSIFLIPSNQLCWNVYGDCNPVQFSPGSPGGVGPYQVEPINVNSQGPAAAGSCPINQYPGYVKYVTNQVQYASGASFAFSGLTVADTITIGSRHDLGSGTSTGSATTTGDGSFQDQYSVCSPACPGSSGETDATQNWTVNGVPLFHINGVVYKCSSISIDGH